MTTLSEPNFTKIDGSNINGALTWDDYAFHVSPDGLAPPHNDSFEIVGNTARPVITEYYYAFTTTGTLATADHWAKITIKNLGDAGGVTGIIGVAVRVQVGYGICYLARMYKGGVNTIELQKLAADGSGTTLGSFTFTPTADPVHKDLKLTVSGSAPAHLVVNWDGTDVITYDDSSSPITGNTTVAMYGYHHPTATVVPAIEAFDSADSGAAVAPNAPTIGVATAGDSTISVTFTESTSDGGSPITDHVATTTPGGFTGHGLTSPILISGPVNGTAYTADVASINAVDTGPASAESNSVTPAEITTPTLGQILDGVASLLAPYLTTVHYDASGFATTVQLNTAVTNIVTSSQLIALFANLASKDDVGLLRRGSLTVTDTSHVRIDGANLVSGEWDKCWIEVKDSAHPRFCGTTISSMTGTGNLDCILDPPLPYLPGAGAVYGIFFVAKPEAGALPVIDPTNIIGAIEANTHFKQVFAQANGQYTITEPVTYPGYVTLVLKDQSGTVTVLSESLWCLTRPSILTRTTA